MRLIVCGGRDFFDRYYASRILNEVHRVYGIQAIAHGGANGADTLAKQWAASNRIPCYEYLANWRTYGKRAGPLRNQNMLREFQPDVVLAFPGGRGTADMVRQAKQAHVLVIEPKGRSEINGESCG